MLPEVSFGRGGNFAVFFPSLLTPLTKTGSLDPEASAPMAGGLGRGGAGRLPVSDDPPPGDSLAAEAAATAPLVAAGTTLTPAGEVAEAVETILDKSILSPSNKMTSSPTLRGSCCCLLDVDLRSTDIRVLVRDPLFFLSTVKRSSVCSPKRASFLKAL